MSNNDVVFFEHTGPNGSLIAQVHLNVPATLNALTLEAVEAMTPKMLDWAARDEVVAVLVTGEGDKALCAGGEEVRSCPCGVCVCRRWVQIQRAPPGLDGLLGASLGHEHRLVRKMRC